MLKTLMTKSALIALACSVSLAVHARADQPKQVNVPAGELVTALESLSKQAAIELVYQPDQLKSYKTRGVRGLYDPQEAVRILLKGTPLELRTDPSGAMVIAPPHTSSASQEKDDTRANGNGEDPKSASGDRRRMAQANPSGSSSSQTVGNPSEASTEASESKRKPVQLEEVIVTGSRLPATSKEKAQPVLVYSRRQIEESGQNSLADLLSTLPQVSMQTTQATFGTLGGSTSVRLHGLPLGSTLVLINGHPSNTGRFSFIDLGTIPPAAVERVEIIPVGSSAIYGSDALAGVVNLILRTDYQGIEANVKYGKANSTDSSDVNLSVGHNWTRGELSLTADFQRQAMLLGSERTATSSGNLAALGGINLFSTDACFPGNVYSLNGQNLPGLNSTFAAIPLKQGTVTIADLQATAGTTHRCSNYYDATLIPRQRQESVLASGHYQLTDRVDFFSELLYSHKVGDNFFGSTINLTSGSSGAYQLAAGNPFNPFGQNVGISYSDPGDSYDFAFNTAAVRPLVGLRGTLASDWRWEANAFYSYSRLRLRDDLVNTALIRSALATSNPATALNPFTSGPPASSSILDSFITPGHDTYEDSLVSGQAFVSGPLLKLPSGAVDTVLGGEYSRYRESDNTVFLPIAQLLRRRAYGLFNEERIPLIANRERSNGSETLALSLAVRYDHSNDFGGKATGQGGLEWRPYDSLLLRGAYGTSYRAPALSRLSGGTTPFFTQIRDPNRGNTTYIVSAIAGPNPNLDPETGKSRSFGLVYSSKALPGLNTSLTWWKVDYLNFIGTVAAQSLLDFPSLFPAGLVTRAAPTATDMQNGFLGTITSISQIPVNFGQINVAGFDFDLSYRVPTAMGDFSSSLAATETYRWDAALKPGASPKSAVSQSDGVSVAGFAPRWKGTAALNWTRGAYAASFTGRYIGHYNDLTFFGGPQPHDIGNFWLYDFNFRSDLGRVFAGNNTWLRDSYLTLGAVNLFNSQPKISYSPKGYDSFQADIRGRFWYAQGGTKW